MNEIFVFEPTAYEVERRRQAAQSPKKRAQGGKKQFKIAINRYTIAARDGTTGMQFEALKHVKMIAKEYGIELDVYFKWLLKLHKEVQNYEPSRH